jgi:hypothetical protein
MSISPITRRRALALGGGAAAGGLITSSPLLTAAQASAMPKRKQHGKLPAGKMQQILDAEGTVSDGLLSIDIARSDIGQSSGPLGVTFSGSFEIDGTLTFEPLGDHLAFFNGDLPLLPQETQPFIDAVIANGLTFQAFHQHYIEMNPQIWFIHWRGVGAPLALAKAVRNVLGVTATPFPQTMPKNPTTPLDSKKLAKILHGDAQVGDNGVVTVGVNRKDHIVVQGTQLNPASNIDTEVQFQPRASDGSMADAAPDFSMTGPEVMPVVETMRAQGWFVSCLYNQETQEHPQLFFSHMLKTGDPYTLAAEIRRGLDKTDSE